MRESIVMKMVDGRTYLATDKDQRKALLPRSSGVYIWTIQLDRALDGMVHGEEVVERFAKPFQRLREERWDTGGVGFYKQVRVYDSPPPLTKSSIKRATELLEAEHEDFSWVAAMGTLFQRPLYVGKALDFRDRVPLHFNYKTTFSEHFRDLGMSMGDLAVTLFSLDWNADHSDGSAVDHGQGDDLEEDDDDEALTAGDESEFEPEEFVPPGREHQDRLIRLAESLLIRQLQPIFNRRVE